VKLRKIVIKELLIFLSGDEVAFSLWKKVVDYHKRSLVETAISGL
jgi:hypothetical protein